jgi:acetolactate synthase-1/3 small subunit
VVANVHEPAPHHILSVLVENKFGVLTRVAGLFARRGFNIVSLAVSPTEDERFSRMTIVVDAASAPLEQVTKQLNKLIPVIKIVELTPQDAVERELMLVTVNATAEARSQITELAAIFEAKIDDVGLDALTLQVAGAPDALDAMTDLLTPFGILELQRTGRIALPKLSRRPTPRLRSVRATEGQPGPAWARSGSWSPSRSPGSAAGVERRVRRRRSSPTRPIPTTASSTPRPIRVRSSPRFTPGPS